MSASAEEHRGFLNQLYGPSRHIYDISRKYYLFGRDPALRALCAGSWSTLVELGPGTGRNLREIHKLRPDARLGGVEASDEMLKHAQARAPYAKLIQGFAETADLSAPLGEAPERILFSYALSMMQEPAEAIAAARAQIAPGGEVWVVDFADLGGMPWPAAIGLRRWLRAFHVRPLAEPLLREGGAKEILYGPGRYWVRAIF